MSDRRVVMISSTAQDLPEHRSGIRDACERAGFEPRMMEQLPALDADAIQASLRLVDEAEAEAYVGIFAYRYGHVPNGHEISITEMEYNRAVERDIPRLIFFIHEDHSVTGKDFETGPGAVKLTALKERLGTERVVGFFKSPGDLRGEVIAALTTLTKELDMTSEGDATAAVVAKLHPKGSIPAPPEPFDTLLQSGEVRYAR